MIDNNVLRGDVVVDALEWVEDMSEEVEISLGRS
jgi:hypothetical protein